MTSPYQAFYTSLPIKKEKHREALYIFSNAERKMIERLEWKAILLSAFIGAMGVIFLYLPKQIWPALFPCQSLQIFGEIYRTPLLFTMYGGLLALTEILVLTFVNIYYIHETSVATGFINKGNKYDIARQNMLLNIANSKTTKANAKYGINPLMGLSKQTIFVIFVLQKAKGALSNVFIKALAGRLGGRFTFQLVQNMLGIPVYAFWDAWAARGILRKTRAVIMGQNLIADLFTHLPKPVIATENFKMVLYECLQYIATSKRYYHENHNLLTEKVFERYGLSINLHDKSPANFIERLKALPETERAICTKIMLTGWLLDESIYEREKMHISALHKQGITTYDLYTVRGLHKKFMAGIPIIDFIRDDT